MKPHELLLERLKAMVKGTPFGAIIILSGGINGVVDVDSTSNIHIDDQIRVLRRFVEQLEAKRRRHPS